MKKLSLLLLLAVLLGAAVAPAMAQDNLTALARYFPADTPLFAAVDISDGTLTQLDAVLGQLGVLLPAGTIPPVTVTGLLDQAIQEQFQGDFQTAIRSWLGDTAALGVLSLDMSSPNAPVIAAVAITDRAKAASFFGGLFAQQIENKLYTKEETDSFTLFVPAKDSYQSTILAIGDEALFIVEDMELLGMPAAPLSENPKFTDTLALLPGEGYAIQVYLDYSNFIGMMMEQSAASMGMMGSMLGDFYNVIGAQAYGFALLDNRAFVMDIVQTYNDTAALEEAGLVMNYPSGPVNADFARYLPADTPVALFGNNLGPATLNGFENLRVFGDMLQAQMKQLPDEAFNNDASRFLRDFNLGSIPTFINLAFSGATGLSLETDVLPWMTGDYALYMRILPGAENGIPPIVPDLALVIEATDPDAAQTLVTAVGSAADQYKLEYATETIGSSQVLAFNAPFLNMLPLNPANVTDMERALVGSIDLLLGSNGEVLVGGTRPGVTYSLNPQGTTLADTPAFAEARQYALAEAESLGYLNLRGFVPLLDHLAGLPTASDRELRDMQQIRMVLGTLSTASFSFSQGGDNAAVGRFVLTLGSEPLPPAE
ncbi:MAG: DUF3352 domain-containing protein [Anaerolineaceae bacterium]|nr:DUF3352 domain-containing protein [Anaerolineaceae bacterium]